MRTLRAAESVRRLCWTWRAHGDPIGFVPTMGALHSGHRALLRRARKETRRVAASIFVNPLQFGPGEDYDRYPRPFASDVRILKEEGVELLYLPRAERLYPEEFQTRVSVTGIGKVLEGAARPGHFDGVATVVAKLLATVVPDRLYLGQKDAQQATLLRRMVADLDLGVRVVVCPTVREPDGLAVSSRNRYLTPPERDWAPALYRTLSEAADRIRSGETVSPEKAAAWMRRRLARGPGRLEYAAAVDPRDFGPPKRGRPVVLAVAYRLPSARLIDNVVVKTGGRDR
ncbi:MAG: pantoate--beta-alanine ligase [Candidatus Eisenbacteria bacterium]|nr:pantoate--beta-alanine ligase [Candidatus Latescibacterota bacterium]MBD3301937.1 pantoate--beta-alanine ligase [Candidatus Eisenbacteria bacterium]